MLRKLMLSPKRFYIAKWIIRMSWDNKPQMLLWVDLVWNDEPLFQNLEIKEKIHLSVTYWFF